MSVLLKKTLLTNLLRISLVAFVAVFMTSCDKSIIYYTYQPVSDAGWAKYDTLYFDVPVNNDSLPLIITTDIRHTAEYPYINLSLIVQQNLKDSLTWVNDTLHFKLIDEKGKRGANNWSSIYEASSAMPAIKPSGKGLYQIKVFHAMANDTLPGVHDIGLKITQ